jgi:hypothetical protein
MAKKPLVLLHQTRNQTKDKIVDKLDEMKRELDEMTDRIEIIKALSLINDGVWSSDFDTIKPIIKSMLFKTLSHQKITMHDFALLSYALNEVY